jgi:redox-sensitive bicupin YhaK (pirin superfamily)
MSTTITPDASTSFVLRAADRGHGRYLSTGASSSYIAGHPEAVLTRESSFNFGPYQEGRAGFGKIRVFGEELFQGLGCGYNMHPHHNFIICAFVLSGQLTHVNTLGHADELHADDYYVFSAGSGGKHCELSITGEDMHVIYVWFLPGQLLLPPTYDRTHFDRTTRRNRIEELVGTAPGALPIGTAVRVSRLVSDAAGEHRYHPSATANGVYAFVIDGQVDCDGTSLATGDSVGVWERSELRFTTGDGPADVLIVETAP